jgi:5'-3' exonuclease
VQIHLVDGTFELFRSYFAAPKAKSPGGAEVGAARGLLRGFAAWLGSGQVTHVACAFDHVIESFRNELFPGYKTGAGLDPDLLAQFELAERVTRALGMVTWPMVEFEADDALASAAHRFERASEVEQVIIASPDKDFAQCVVGSRVVCWDRMRSSVLDETGVRGKFGIEPRSIPDYLSLVGDSADGIPGVPRWGAKSAATLLAVYTHLEHIPERAADWRVGLRGADALAASLSQCRELALLYRKLATLRLDVPLTETLDELAWRGAPAAELAALCDELGDASVLERMRERGRLL